jgi:ABC-type dipeptide/oligopeptide/nickel transport system permease subunit
MTADVGASRSRATGLLHTVRVGYSRRPRSPHWSVTLGISTFLLVCLAIAIAPLVMPHDPNAQDLGARLAMPSTAHLLGTDAYGRDVLSRLLAGGRFSVTIAFITLVLSTVIGTVMGIVCGRLGGFIDEVFMRVSDVLLAFPDILLALVLIAILGSGPQTVILAMTLVGWTAFARLSRTLTLEINTRGYIEAARALGCSQRFITMRHVLPNTMNPIMALALSRFSYQLVTVGSLSYLGLGVQPPDSDWGSMLADGQPYMQQMPLLVLIPGLAIFVTALSLTLAGQGLSRRANRIAQSPDGAGALTMEGELLPHESLRPH